MYLIAVYVPETHINIVKNAMFSSGAGKYKNYDCCSWQTSGTGQFRPLDGSSPFIGDKGNIEQVIEVKVEMICDESKVREVIHSMINAHPYEEPAYHIVKILSLEDFHEKTYNFETC